MPHKDPEARKAYNREQVLKKKRIRDIEYFKICNKHYTTMLPKSKARGVINGIPYIADESGYIESVPHIDQIGRFWPGKQLRHVINTHGYPQVVLSYCGLRFSGAVHALMMRAFNEPLDGADVNHKNGIKSDNRLTNLEYVSRQYNQLHSCWELGNNDPKLKNQSKEKICKLWSLGLLKHAGFA